MIQLTRALAVEYLKTPLRVNAGPAGTNTNLVTSVQLPSDLDPDLARRMGGLRGMAEPDEVAALFAFLASDEARSTTGAIYTVDNGLQPPAEPATQRAGGMGRMFLLWWKTLSGSYLALTLASRR